MQVNNRKLVQGFYRGLGVERRRRPVLRAVEKLDKIGPDAVRDGDHRRGHSTPSPTRACSSPRSRHGRAVVEQVQALGVRTDELERGSAPSSPPCSTPLVGDAARVEVVAALKIARGLDYYTGTVMETVMEGYEHLGSVSAGGRYDALASDGEHDVPRRGHLVRASTAPCAAAGARA